MFADDINFYRVVNCYKDAALLQSDLNLFFNRCYKLFFIYYITLNIKKYQVPNDFLPFTFQYFFSTIISIVYLYPE